MVRWQLCQMIIGVWGCGFISFRHFGQGNRGPFGGDGRIYRPLLFHGGAVCVASHSGFVVLTHNLVINVKPQG